MNETIRVGSILKARAQAKVAQDLSYAGSGCHGYQRLVATDGSLQIPGWDLPPGSELVVEISVRVTKLGKRSRKRCENPWPAHRHDTEDRDGV